MDDRPKINKGWVVGWTDGCMDRSMDIHVIIM